MRNFSMGILAPDPQLGYNEKFQSDFGLCGPGRIVRVMRGLGIIQVPREERATDEGLIGAEEWERKEEAAQRRERKKKEERRKKKEESEGKKKNLKKEEEEEEGGLKKEMGYCL